MRRTIIYISILLVSFHSGCSQKESKQVDRAEDSLESGSQAGNMETDANNTPDDVGFLITETGVAGFKVGDLIDPGSANILTRIEETGEGSFPVHVMLDQQGDEVGIIYTEMENEGRILYLEVTSPKYKTRQGLGVGSNYRELKDQYPDLEIHGSEIESRTTASPPGSLSFLLDVYFSSYHIDESQIDPLTKVRQVTIWPRSPKRALKDPDNEPTEPDDSPALVSHYICFNQDDNQAVTIWISYTATGKAIQVKFKGMDEVTDLVFQGEENTNEDGPYPVIVEQYDAVHEGKVTGQYKITHSGIWDYVEYTRAIDSAVFNFTIDHEADPYGESPCF